MRSLLVTNDFPPKVGGIQSYLWELWRRLPAETVAVYTTPYTGDDEFDRVAEPLRIIRSSQKVLLPNPILIREVNELIDELKIDLVFLDPALPLGAIGRYLKRPYVAVLHGAEVTIPGRLPVSRRLLRSVLQRSEGVLCAGGYPAAEGIRAAEVPLKGLIIPPGVDVERFQPATEDERAATRDLFGFDPEVPLVLGLSRLVPRKGFDTLIEAVKPLEGEVQLAIGGSGRDFDRLKKLAARAPHIHLLGRVPEEQLAPLYASADVFSMLCRDRWFGLEREGFGIVFLEAAACGVPAVAGRSGGAHEAVADGVSGRVVPPKNQRSVQQAIREVLSPANLGEMRVQARLRAVEEFSYDALAARLAPLARGDLTVLETLTV